MRRKKDPLAEIGKTMAGRKPRIKADCADGMTDEANEIAEEKKRKEAQDILDSMEQFADKCSKEDTREFLSNPKNWRSCGDADRDFLHSVQYVGPITEHMGRPSGEDAVDPAIRRHMPPKRVPLEPIEIALGGRYTIPHKLRYDMTFSEAYDLLGKGSAVRRACWPSFEFIWKPKTWKLREGCEASRDDPVMQWALTLVPSDTFVEPVFFTYRLVTKEGGGLKGVVLPNYYWPLYDQMAEDWEEIFRPGMYDGEEKDRKPDKPVAEDEPATEPTFYVHLPSGTETI